jgi:hypothetical protein
LRPAWAKSLRSHLNQWLGIVVCTCHPAAGEAEIRRIRFQPSLGKFMRPHLNSKKLGMVTCTCPLSYDVKHKIGRPQSRPVQAERDPISKITKTKRTGGMAQAVQRLLSLLISTSTAEKHFLAHPMGIY